MMLLVGLARTTFLYFKPGNQQPSPTALSRSTEEVHQAGMRLSATQSRKKEKI